MAATKRQKSIDPYTPNDTENLGDDTGQYSTSDLGKGLKMSGDAMVALADGDPIEAFVTAVEPGTSEGYSIGSVNRTNRQFCLDEAGTLAVGNVVVAGTVTALGTVGIQKVKVEPVPGTSAGYYPWEVIRVDGAGANRSCMVRPLF